MLEISYKSLNFSLNMNKSNHPKKIIMARNCKALTPQNKSDKLLRIVLLISKKLTK